MSTFIGKSICLSNKIDGSTGCWKRFSEKSKIVSIYKTVTKYNSKRKFK